jgi:hypothetical protein
MVSENYNIKMISQEVITKDCIIFLLTFFHNVARRCSQETPSSRSVGASQGCELLPP